MPYGPEYFADINPKKQERLHRARPYTEREHFTTPFFVQPAELMQDGKLRLPRVFNSHYEQGEQFLSFASVARESSNVPMHIVVDEEKGQAVYAFTTKKNKKYLATEYAKTLKPLFDNDKYCDEPIFLKSISEGIAEPKGDFDSFAKNTNVWIDWDNDVVFALSEETADMLGTFMGEVRKESGWARKLVKTVMPKHTVKPDTKKRSILDVFTEL